MNKQTLVRGGMGMITKDMLSVDDRVYHKKYGSGTIIQIPNVSNIIRINFDNKQLMSYCTIGNLSRIEITKDNFPNDGLCFLPTPGSDTRPEGQIIPYSKEGLFDLDCYNGGLYLPLIKEHQISIENGF